MIPIETIGSSPESNQHSQGLLSTNLLPSLANTRFQTTGSRETETSVPGPECRFKNTTAAGPGFQPFKFYGTTSPQSTSTTSESGFEDSRLPSRVHAHRPSNPRPTTVQSYINKDSGGSTNTRVLDFAAASLLSPQQLLQTQPAGSCYSIESPRCVPYQFNGRSITFGTQNILQIQPRVPMLCPVNDTGKQIGVDVVKDNVGVVENDSLFLGCNEPTRIHFFQGNSPPEVIHMRPINNGSIESMELQLASVKCGGSFQDLLRTVSLPSWNAGVTQQQYREPLLEENVEKDARISGNNIDSVQNGEKSYKDIKDCTEVDIEDSADSDAEEEQLDADDEDSDAVLDQKAGMQRPSIENGSNLESEISIQYEMVRVHEVGSRLPRKRRRFPKGYIVPDFRPPRDMGTIEKAMRLAEYREVGTNIFEPKLGMVFDSRAEIYNFYNMYSWEVGFGIRFGSFAKNRVNQMRTMQELVCEKEGFDSRCNRNSKRMRCKAKIRLHRTDDLGWYLSKHISEHNHPLSVSFGEKMEWNSHCRIEQCTKSIITYLRENNISLSKVHCFMGSMYGSMQAVPFNQKALRAVCAEISRDQKGDDIAKTLEVFRKMRAKDPGFQFSLDLDGEKKIKTLLWTSGRSRSQYNFFGDAITFDTTYCTNIYNMPFGMFVGVNNHFQSILFAGVLMIKEDTESFKWVFKEFITLMGGKYPVTILTDQCKAMTKAVKEVFPESTTHLWCKWHVLRYAPEELGPIYRRNGPFRRDFHFVINQMLTIEEFERAWNDLLQVYGLKDNDFMKRTYEKRHKWAKPWSRNTFCAKMASTQRSESANSILKKVVPRNSSMNHFVQQYDKLLFIRASAEQKAEHETKQFVHRTKRMYPVEKHSITVYTKNTFQLFSEEADKAADFDVEQGPEENTYLVIHNNAETKKHWARVLFKVEYDNHIDKFFCECGNYEHFGMLCCHVVKVMIVLGVKKIPQANIMKRWTRDACDYKYPEDLRTTPGQMLGQSLLYANALDVVNSSQVHPKAGAILNKHLNMARKEIDGLNIALTIRDYGSDGTATPGYISAAGTETDKENQCDFDSDGEPVNRNTYGAAGSSRYMSDADVSQVKAPMITPKSGRKREKRFKPMFERARKGRKRYTGNPKMQEALEDDCNIEQSMFPISETHVEVKKKKAKKSINK